MASDLQPGERNVDVWTVDERNRAGVCVECGLEIKGPYSHTFLGRVHGAFLNECDKAIAELASSALSAEGEKGEG